MKILDKVKNMFTEEVEEEVQVEQIKPKKNKVDLEPIDQIKEEKRKEEEKKPIFFTDDDFNDMRSFEQEKRVKKVEEKPFIKEEAPTLPYRQSAPYEEVKPVKKFKPTPIISPVYGILDKNYHKEDIVDKTDDYNAVDGLSVDSIRNKAYGTLEDELENTLFGNNSILFNDKEQKDEGLDEIEDETENDLLDNLTDNKEESVDRSLEDLENITMDIGKELDSLLNKDKKADIKEVDKTKNDNTSSFDDDDDLFNLIDTMYDGDDAYDA